LDLILLFLIHSLKIYFDFSQKLKPILNEQQANIKANQFKILI